MSTLLTWRPSDAPTVYRYLWQRAADVSGAPGEWADLAVVLHDLSGTDYDPTTNHFFYADTTGVVGEWYRMDVVDDQDVVLASTAPFLPPVPFPNTIVLNENYGAPNALQPTDPDGVPLIGVQIRVWRKIDYDLQNLEAAVGTTTTSITGAWVSPLIVEAGYTYVVQFDKPGLFGPNTTEVVVP